MAGAAASAASVLSWLGELSFWFKSDQPIMAMTIPPGELHDGQRDTEESEECGADELDDREEDDGIDGDSAGEGAVGVGGCVADETEEDERGAQGVDERKKRAEAQSKVFPEKEHGFTWYGAEVAAMLDVIVTERK